jgi:hypothetical protein
LKTKKLKSPRVSKPSFPIPDYEHLNPYTLVMLCRWVHPLPNFRAHFMGSKDLAGRDNF